MNEHTPGPWTYRKNEFWPEGQGCFVIEQENMPEDEACHAIIFRVDVNTEANARLIAASPILFECLQAVELAARIDCLRTDAWTELLAICRKALADAKGEEQ